MGHVYIGGLKYGIWIEDDNVWTPALVNCLDLFVQIGLTFIMELRQKHGLNNKYGEQYCGN